ncbi:metallophosphoesterase [Bordetella genomosp. 9]|uniref:Metallophosphoesterase n=1 Tax=Bordetella genomosp. 9 TaxID=1416803 RepID=A0A1W6Z0B3_9BORD|nr:metallophosphoesterase [Bordetella genomosp. 9]ARP86748.1 metallophosphoesterase [Bordetella genomosp. 9]
MKIQLLSDLHLETNADFQPQPAPGADLLILAGDIGSYQPGSRLADDDFGLGRFSPRNGWPVPVVYLPGNHEYDALDFDTTHRRLRELCDQLEIQWLERETLIIEGVRFVGTTLWTDFDALAAPGDTLTQVLRKRGKAFRAANFYLEKAGTVRNGEPFLAEALREQGLACQAWLREALEAPFEGPTVAVTHFAPTLSSADPRYGVTPGTAGFCNALDDLLPRADLWLHGHLHRQFDYVQDGCRVVANPLGYAGKGEQENFKPTLTLDLDGLGKRPARSHGASDHSTVAGD